MKAGAATCRKKMKAILTPARFTRSRPDKGFGLAAALSLLLHIAAVVLFTGIASSPPLLREAADDGVIRVSLISATAAGAEETGSEKSAGSVGPTAAEKQARARKEKVRTEKAEKPDNPAVSSVAPDRIAAMPEEDFPSSGRLSALRAAEGRQQEPLTPLAHNSGGGVSRPGGREGEGGAALHSPGATTAMPRYRENSRPVYPAVARSRGYEGLVILSAEVSVDGRVGKIKVAKTSGYPLLDRSALEAVRLWKFIPGRRLGIPVTVWVDIPIRFSLHDGDG